MNNVKTEPCQVIGIAVRTTNENNQAAADIGVLWEKFMKESIPDAIPDKMDTTVMQSTQITKKIIQNLIPQFLDVR